MSDEKLKSLLEKEGAKVLDFGENYAVQVKEGGITQLEADNLSDALYEACMYLGLEID